MSYTQIGKALGIDPTTAAKAISKNKQKRKVDLCFIGKSFTFKQPFGQFHKTYYFTSIKRYSTVKY